MASKLAEVPVCPRTGGIRVWSTPAYCVEITRDFGPPDRSEAPKKVKMDLWEDRERRARRERGRRSGVHDVEGYASDPGQH